MGVPVPTGTPIVVPGGASDATDATASAASPGDFTPAGLII